MSNNDDTTMLKGSDIPREIVAPKCQALYKSICKKDISFQATGEQANTGLVSFLQCQFKVTKTCIQQSKEYSLCHKSVMGMGSYKGRRNCALELEILYHCVVVSKE